MVTSARNVLKSLIFKGEEMTIERLAGIRGEPEQMIIFCILILIWLPPLTVVPNFISEIFHFEMFTLLLIRQIFQITALKACHVLV